MARKPIEADQVVDGRDEPGQGAEALAPAAEVPLSCGNCECYRDRHLDPELQAKAATAGHPMSAGLCQLNPVLVPKKPDDTCGQHSELQTRRLRYLAHQIAMSLKSGEQR